MTKTFEAEKTSVLQFMQCLEDILGYITRFSYGSMSLTTSSTENPSSATSIDEIHVSLQKWSRKFDRLCFIISRGCSSSSPPKTLHVVATFDECQPPSSTLFVKECQVSSVDGLIKSMAENRGELRDLICDFFVPSLRIFSLLDFLLLSHPSHQMNIVPHPSPPASESPECCMEIGSLSGNPKKVLIALDANDYDVVTWEKGSDVRKTWSFKEPEEEAGSNRLSHIARDHSEEAKDPLFPGTCLPFLSYILGTVLMPNSDQKMN